mmetsp:Transcript_32098/g.94599  ORF Transcript_32098/g.94599 Transcript_32098/m.94599 type:complete len:330 (+) Transcript_32098:584-1573(+)
MSSRADDAPAQHRIHRLEQHPLPPALGALALVLRHACLLEGELGRAVVLLDHRDEHRRPVAGLPRREAPLPLDHRPLAVKRFELRVLALNSARKHHQLAADLSRHARVGGRDASDALRVEQRLIQHVRRRVVAVHHLDGPSLCRLCRRRHVPRVEALARRRLLRRRLVPLHHRLLELPDKGEAGSAHRLAALLADQLLERPLCVGLFVAEDRHLEVVVRLLGQVGHLDPPLCLHGRPSARIKELAFPSDGELELVPGRRDGASRSVLWTSSARPATRAAHRGKRFCLRDCTVTSPFIVSRERSLPALRVPSPMATPSKRAPSFSRAHSV